MEVYVLVLLPVSLKVELSYNSIDIKGSCLVGWNGF